MIKPSEQLRRAVLQALEDLRNVFPLSRHLDSADGPVRRVYGAILGHWVREGRAPALDTKLEPELASLHALGLIAVDAHGIGCFPFSARPTGIFVTDSAASIDAGCVVDALAVPRFRRREARIYAPCGSCGEQMHCQVEGSGALDHGYDPDIRVIWPRLLERPGMRYDEICKEVHWVCGACARRCDAEGFTLAQAAVLGNAFFGAQYRFLGTAEDPPAHA